MEHKILSSVIQYSAHAFDAAKVQLRLPDLREREYDLVVHAPAVVIVPCTADRKILFVRQYRVGADKILIELPAGVINDAEDPLLAARRELREETGYEAKTIRKIGGFYMAAGYSTEYLHIYFAEDLVWNPLPADDDEFLSVQATGIDEVFQMVQQAQIEDSKTLAALMLAQGALLS